ncbi:Eukaryotic translation initiation factor 3 subunit M [Nymphaea thermarum]|nr:Eukaryotic translation initiation factor 3 subunit M [Nymphaea thermarum]
MAAIVETSEEDLALAVVRFTSELAWADAGPEIAENQVARLCHEAQEFVVMGRWVDLASLMLTSADLVFSRVSDKDLDCIYTVICNLVTKAGSPDEAMEIADRICIKITQQPNKKPETEQPNEEDEIAQPIEKPALRLKILFNLYNLLEHPYSRFFVYEKALELAIRGKVTESIIPSFKKIDNFLKEWEIAPLEQRRLFLKISNVLGEIKSSSKEYFSFLTKYLATFSNEDAHTMSKAKPAAERAIFEFVKAPDMFQCDLLDMPAVRQLEKDGKYALAFQLLKIFLTQRLDAYLDFQAANSTLLKSHGLVHEECITKMRLMSLVDLSSNGSSEIPYATIRDTLRIKDDEVEYWVVRAISAKLLDCKMDQMNETVIVSRHTERMFGPSQWEVLRSRLEEWRANVTNALRTIQYNKASEEAPQSLQGGMIR